MVGKTIRSKVSSSDIAALKILRLVRKNPNIPEAMLDGSLFV